jgi:hypothetical protein
LSRVLSTQQVWFYKQQEKPMSSPERFVRYYKRQTDAAIHDAFKLFSADSAAGALFHELLHCVRTRAPRWFEAPVLSGSHPSVQALVHLAQFHRAHIRPAADWLGNSSSWQRALSSLAHHLVGRYPVPAFLASAWYVTDEAADRKRHWFVAHAGGARFRSLDLPVAMTRRMEHIFLASPDHFAIEYALRRAELLSLGVPAAFVEPVLSTRLATDLTNGAFWPTVWAFLIANAGSLDPVHIAPLIDFLQAIREEHPAFTLKGRTVASLLRLMKEWHRSLGLSSSATAWTPSTLQPMVLEEPSQDPSVPPKRWHLLELTNSAQLRTEGVALHHCVASYAHRCHGGLSRIWSLRLRRGENVQHVLTIEVDPKRRAVVQARGRANRPASGKPLRLLEDWAAREKLQLAMAVRV